MLISELITTLEKLKSTKGDIYIKGVLSDCESNEVLFSLVFPEDIETYYYLLDKLTVMFQDRVIDPKLMEN